MILLFDFCKQIQPRLSCFHFGSISKIYSNGFQIFLITKSSYNNIIKKSDINLKFLLFSYLPKLEIINGQSLMIHFQYFFDSNSFMCTFVTFLSQWHHTILLCLSFSLNVCKYIHIHLLYATLVIYHYQMQKFFNIPVKQFYHVCNSLYIHASFQDMYVHIHMIFRDSYELHMETIQICISNTA